MNQRSIRTTSILACGLALALLAATPVLAADNGTTRIVSGTITAPGGTQLAFSTPEGKALVVRSVDGARFFEVRPQILDPQTVRLAVQEFADRDRQVPLAREELSLPLNGKVQKDSRLPFGIALTGITFDTKVPSRQVQRKGLGEVQAQAECCVECGSWEVCCEPSAGWCCELECLGSGETCEACTAFQ